MEEKIMKDPWYVIANEDQIDSPALLLFSDRVGKNISKMIIIAGSPGQLMPHVKTHKVSAIVKMHLLAGITQFKCATIAEAEMLAKAGVKNVLIAYQLTKQKLTRFIQLVKLYPDVCFASLIDNLKSANLADSVFKDNSLTANIYIDIDNGMHRTGLSIEENILGFYKQVTEFKHVLLRGFHIYDGHVCETDLAQRKVHCETAMAPVYAMLKSIPVSERINMQIIAGGSPTFPIHALNPNVICSPGTTVLWDKGYKELFPDLPFLYAAILFTRIISKPSKRLITLDLGYKSVASENPVDKRVSFLNLDNYNIMSQDEEHLVIKVSESDWINLNIGDALYGVPNHICPTVALYNEVQVVEDASVTTQWTVEARGKKITI